MRSYSSLQRFRPAAVPLPVFSATTALSFPATASQQAPLIAAAYAVSQRNSSSLHFSPCRRDKTSNSSTLRSGCSRHLPYGRRTSPLQFFCPTTFSAQSANVRGLSTDGTEKSSHETDGAAAASNTTLTSTDPMSMSASPRYASHAEAERIAYQQEDNVQHRDFGVGTHGDNHDGHDCGCGADSSSALSTAAESKAAASAPPPQRRGRRDFSDVFNQEVAAWRAIHKHDHKTDAAAQTKAPSATSSGKSSETTTTSAAAAAAVPHLSGSASAPHSHHHDASHFHVHPEDVPPGMTYEAYVEHLEAEEEMQRFLAQNTMHSIRRSMARDNAAAEAEAVLTTNSTMRTRLEPHQGYRGVQTLLDYNKQWAAEVSRFNPRYFIELAKEQKPEYLWIGCSDSRVPANEVIGLHPGDVFVHRNIGNIFSLSDLNCLSALQFAVDCLKVQHVIIAGHYKCGGVTAAMRGDNLGLTDHWIMQVVDIKNKWWDRVLSDIPEEFHLNVLCELNVLEQLSHVVNCRIVQRRWKAQNANDRYYGRTAKSVYVRPEYATKHLSEKKIRSNLPTTVVNYEEELEVHGWVYSLDDGMLRPLLSLTRHSNVKKEISEAIEALFIRYSQMT